MTDPAATHWCELAWLGDPAREVDRGVALAIRDGRIESVEVGVLEPPAGSERLAGLTTPGFANAHSHAFHRALRGRTHGSTGSFWTWRDQMYELAARLDPDSYRDLAAATFAEMALAGFTCVGEFHYLHHDHGGRPYADANAMADSLRQAADDAGVRLTLLDTCYLQAAPEAPPAGVQLRFSDGDVDAWAARASSLAASGRVRIGAAVHSVRAVEPAAIAVVARWAAERSAPLHVHVSEQPVENEQCLASHGCTPVELLDGAGALGARTTAVHATHVTPGDIALLAAASAACCLCPTTERDLADGIGPGAALVVAGVALCLGTDSHAVIDPFEEARAVELDERLASRQRGTHAPPALLEMATGAGYRSLGWPDGGRIAAGALADLTTISLDSPRLAGTGPASATAGAVFAATAADVRHVMVGGDAVVRDGRHVRADVAADLGRAIRAVWA